jgi:membrane protease YdiL (CAAX protease family)
MTEKELHLYKLAKFTNLEIVMEAQVLSSGANQARLLEKYKKSKGTIKQQAFAMKIAFAAMLLFVVVLPITTYYGVVESFSNSGIPSESVLIPGAILFGAYFIMQAIYLIMLGMFSIGSMMTGDTFRWYETLPISKAKLRKLGFMTVFRNMDIGLIVMILAFPITIFIVSFNIILTLAAALISVMNTLFSFSLLVLVAGKISRVLKVSEAASKKSTLIRIFTMLSYVIVIFSASFFIQWIIMSAGAFFVLFAFLEVPYIVHLIFSILPFPFAPGFLMTMAISPTNFSFSYWLPIIIGMVLFALLTLFVYKKALKAMRTVTSSASIEIKQASSLKETREKIIEVRIEPMTPIKAYIKKDLSMATRDIQTFMFIITPLILPIMVLVPILITPTGLGDSFLVDYAFMWLIITMYQPMNSMMLTSGFLNMEDTGASTLSSLPILPRSQAKGKLLLLGSIQTVSYFLTLFMFIGNPDFINYLLTFISFYPVVITLLISMFQMKVRFFGRMKYKFVVEELHPEKKITKWSVMIIAEYLVFFAFYVMGLIFFVYLGPFVMYIANILGGIFALVVLMISFNSMFPKVPGKKQTISIRELYRKYPLFGTLNLLFLYAGFLILPGFIGGLIIFLLIILSVDITFIALLFIEFFVTFGVMALLWLQLVPRSLGLPNGKESLKKYVKTIGLKPDHKIVRNILLGIGCSIIYFISTYIFGNIFGNYIFDLDVIFGNPGTSISIYGWFLFILMLIPGIWEEFSFRGVISTLNLRKYSQRTVLIVVSLLFGLFHFFNLISGSNLILTGVQVVYASLMGFLFGYLFIKTKSLIPSIILHYLINSVGQLFTYVVFENTLEGTIRLVLFAIIGVGIIPSVFGMLLVKLVVKKDPK